LGGVLLAAAMSLSASLFLLGGPVRQQVRQVGHWWIRARQGPQTMLSQAAQDITT